jgi:hypothetical protein
MSYNGYWAAFAPDIRRLAAQGLSCQQIADKLRYVLPETLEQGMVRYILRGPQAKKKKKTAKWQTWTPEMQEAEFQREYAE